jgi:hypothetical protein
MRADKELSNQWKVEDDKMSNVQQALDILNNRWGHANAPHDPDMLEVIRLLSEKPLDVPPQVAALKMAWDEVEQQLIHSNVIRFKELREAINNVTEPAAFSTSLFLALWEIANCHPEREDGTHDEWSESEAFTRCQQIAEKALKDSVNLPNLNDQIFILVGSVIKLFEAHGVYDIGDESDWNIFLFISETLPSSKEEIQAWSNLRNAVLEFQKISTKALGIK